MEREEVEPLPSSGVFGYDPPVVTKNPKSVRFGFEDLERDGELITWWVKADDEIGVLVNDQYLGTIAPSEEWRFWGTSLHAKELNSSQNVIEFRNLANQDRSSSFSRWQLTNVRLLESGNAKLIAGATFLGSSPPVLETALGAPFPTPFNAGVTLPFTTAETGQVRISVFNLMGQQIRVLHDGWTGAGAHEAHWDGRTETGTDAASGIYWALLRAEELAQSTRLVLIR